jgi:RraA family protein
MVATTHSSEAAFNYIYTVIYPLSSASILLHNISILFCGCGGEKCFALSPQPPFLSSSSGMNNDNNVIECGDNVISSSTGTGGGSELFVVPFQHTADLYDTYLDRARIVDVPYSSNGTATNLIHQQHGGGDMWHSYGGRAHFCGIAVTVQCLNDNSKVKELLEGTTRTSQWGTTTTTTITAATGSTQHQQEHESRQAAAAARDTSEGHQAPPQAQPAPPYVLVVDGGGSRHCALLGDQLAAAAVQSQCWAGIVVYGCVRDVHVLGNLPIGIVAIGTTPRKSIRRGQGEHGVPITIGEATIHPGDYVFVDRDGVLVLDPDDVRWEEELKGSFGK